MTTAAGAVSIGGDAFWQVQAAGTAGMQAEHVIANLAAPAQCKLCLALPSQLNSHATCAPARPSHLQEKDEFVENIIADIQRLGLRFEKISYTSDYVPQLKECGERMIKAGGCRAGPAGRACAGPGWRACPRTARSARPPCG